MNSCHFSACKHGRRHKIYDGLVKRSPYRVTIPGDGTTYFAKSISGVHQRLGLGGDHAFVGASAPDLIFVDGSTR